MSPEAGIISLPAALKNRRFAEYYLAGTLTSVLVAIVAGLVLTAFLRGW